VAGDCYSHINISTYSVIFGCGAKEFRFVFRENNLVIDWEKNFTPLPIKWFSNAQTKLM